MQIETEVTDLATNNRSVSSIFNLAANTVVLVT
jgi:hypothetical protein